MINSTNKISHGKKCATKYKVLFTICGAKPSNALSEKCIRFEEIFKLTNKKKEFTRFEWYSETRIPEVGIASNRRSLSLR